MCKVENGVGSRLAELIPDWAVKHRNGCECKEYECIMNKWGPDGCEQQTNLIAQHLVTQSDKLIPAMKALPPVARRVIAKALVRKAIAQERARLAE